MAFTQTVTTCTVGKCCYDFNINPFTHFMKFITDKSPLLSLNNLFGTLNILNQSLINAVKLDDLFLIITALLYLVHSLTIRK